MKGLVMLTVFAVAAFGATGAHAEDLEAGIWRRRSTCREATGTPIG